MFKKIFLVIALVLILGGCTLSQEKHQNDYSDHFDKNEITRKEELELEGFINDYFYRRQIKDQLLFGDFNAYGSVISSSIVVYVYPKYVLSEERLEDISDMVQNDLQEQLFGFSDFEWAKDYSFDVVVRQ